MLRRRSRKYRVALIVPLLHPHVTTTASPSFSLSPLLSRYISHFTHSANWPRPPQQKPPPEYQLAGKTQTTTKKPSSLLLSPATETERRRRAFPSAPGERLSLPPPKSLRPPAAGQGIKERSGGRNAKPAVGRPLWSFPFKPFFPPPPCYFDGRKSLCSGGGGEERKNESG